MGRNRLTPDVLPWKKKTIMKDVPNEDTSFIGMNAIEYLAYLRHDKKSKKKEEKEED